MVWNEKAFEKHKVLIPYITAGDPSLSVTEQLIYSLEKAGADIIELGIPFSDPLADGPVIQASHLRALKKNISLTDVFKLVKKVRRKTSIPICFMLAYNLIVQYGEEKFYDSCEASGVDGVIIPDLTPEESHDLDKQTVVKTIYLVAPTSTDERIKLAVAKSTGFIYLVSVAGITGVRQGLADNLEPLIARIRSHSDLPIAIGFGISTPKQAAIAADLADGVIVGSALVSLIAQGKTKAVPKFVASLRTAIDA